MTSRVRRSISQKRHTELYRVNKSRVKARFFYACVLRGPHVERVRLSHVTGSDITQAVARSLTVIDFRPGAVYSGNKKGRGFPDLFKYLYAFTGENN